MVSRSEHSSIKRIIDPPQLTEQASTQHSPARTCSSERADTAISAESTIANVEGDHPWWRWSDEPSDDTAVDRVWP